MPYSDSLSGNSVNLHRILFICTSSSGNPAWSSGTTGLWLEELVIPYYVFQDAGYNIDICTVTGGRPPIDEACFNRDNINEQCQNFLRDSLTLNKFDASSSLKNILDLGQVSRYGCIFLCGGHGAIDDFPGNDDITKAVEIVHNVSYKIVSYFYHFISIKETISFFYHYNRGVVF